MPTAESVDRLPAAKGRKFYLIQHLEDWTGPRERVLATWKLPLEKLVIARWLKDIAIELGESTSYQPHSIDTAFFAMAVPPQDRDPLSVLFPSPPLEWQGAADVVAALNEIRPEGVPLKVRARKRTSLNPGH